MRTKLSIFSFSLFLTLIVASGNIVCEAQLEWSTTYNVNVHTDGSASWIIERGTLLKTEEDESNFRRYYFSLEHSQEFSDNIDALVNETRLRTGRDMRAEKFKIITSITSQTETTSYGTVKYQFDWLNFTEVRDTRIIVGDAFIEGIFLFGDGALTIEYPSEYNVADIYPKPDATEPQQTLRWNRIGTFVEGEPRFTLEKKTQSPMSFLQEYASLIIAVVALAGIGSASFWFFRFKRREKMGIPGPAPPIPLGVENEEEKVVALLRAAGGPLYQSTITKQFGFSRSKTCKLLGAMEEKGIIRRQKRGREKLVTLAGK